MQSREGAEDEDSEGDIAELHEFLVSQSGPDSLINQSSTYIASVCGSMVSIEDLAVCFVRNEFTSKEALAVLMTMVENEQQFRDELQVLLKKKMEEKNEISELLHKELKEKEKITAARIDCENAIELLNVDEHDLAMLNAALKEKNDFIAALNEKIILLSSEKDVKDCNSLLISKHINDAEIFALNAKIKYLNELASNLRNESQRISSLNFQKVLELRDLRQSRSTCKRILKRLKQETLIKVNEMIEIAPESPVNNSADQNTSLQFQEEAIAKLEKKCEEIQARLDMGTDPFDSEIRERKIDLQIATQQFKSDFEALAKVIQEERLIIGNNRMLLSMYGESDARCRQDSKVLKEENAKLDELLNVLNLMKNQIAILAAWIAEHENYELELLDSIVLFQSKIDKINSMAARFNSNYKKATEDAKIAEIEVFRVQNSLSFINDQVFLFRRQECEMLFTLKMIAEEMEEIKVFQKENHVNLARWANRLLALRNQFIWTPDMNEKKKQILDEQIEMAKHNVRVAFKNDAIYVDSYESLRYKKRSVALSQRVNNEALLDALNNKKFQDSTTLRRPIYALELASIKKKKIVEKIERMLDARDVLLKMITRAKIILDDPKFKDKVMKCMERIVHIESKIKQVKRKFIEQKRVVDQMTRDFNFYYQAFDRLDKHHDMEFENLERLSRLRFDMDIKVSDARHRIRLLQRSIRESKRAKLLFESSVGEMTNELESNKKSIEQMQQNIKEISEKIALQGEGTLNDFDAKLMPFIGESIKSMKSHLEQYTADGKKIYELNRQFPLISAEKSKIDERIMTIEKEIFATQESIQVVLMKSEADEKALCQSDFVEEEKTDICSALKARIKELEADIESRNDIIELRECSKRLENHKESLVKHKKNEKNSICACEAYSRKIVL